MTEQFENDVILQQLLPPPSTGRKDGNPYRLLNPTKPDIGKITKQFLEVINTTKRGEKTKLKQWKNTNSAIKWYKNLKNKQKLKFIQCDVESFYPSISKDLLLKSLNWAKQFLTITDQQIEVILQSKMNLLYKDSIPWSKKGNSVFDGNGGI